MLFVSRFAGRFSYGVVDTDDWSEEVVSSKDIIDAVRTHGIEILGTTLEYALSKQSKVSVSGIRPYQLPERVTNLQVKTNLLHRVQVVVYRDVIANVTWCGDEILQPVAIRLSDFGSVVGDRFLFCNQEYGSHKITLILDDKLEFSDQSFMKPFAPLSKTGIGTVFDLHDMKNSENVFEIYKSLLMGLNGADMAESILDCEPRKKEIFSMLFSGGRGRRAVRK